MKIKPKKSDDAIELAIKHLNRSLDYIESGKVQMGTYDIRVARLYLRSCQTAKELEPETKIEQPPLF